MAAIFVWIKMKRGIFVEDLTNIICTK